MAEERNTPGDLIFTGLYSNDGSPIYKASDSVQGKHVRQPTRYVVTGAQMGAPVDFFGPGEPLFPMGPKGGEGRQFDFPVGYNIRTRPRQEEGISFEELRLLAEHHDVTRLLIETRKDQMCSLEWNVRIKEELEEQNSEAENKEANDRADKTKKFLEYPDGVTPFTSWLRLVLEDLLVIDAPSVYVNETRRGDTRFEIIDGATIKRVLDPRGRTPEAPDPAYQQIIHGLPAWDYSADELMYYPRNPRPGFIYGCSPVQQIVIAVNISLRKQMSQLQYYTDGNIPDALIGTPPEWTPSQILEYQRAWDALHEGNTAMRRRAKFVPGDAKIQQTREVILKDDFDEWLARIACYAFSIPPTAFVKQVNRATAQTAQEAAQEEGLFPLMQWAKQLFDRMIQHYLGQDDLEFKWLDKDDTDPNVQSQIMDRKIRNGTLTINEAREQDGLDPIPGGDVAMIFMGTAPVPVHVAAEASVIPGEPAPEAPMPKVPGSPTGANKPAPTGTGGGKKPQGPKVPPGVNEPPEGGRPASAPPPKPPPVIAPPGAGGKPPAGKPAAKPAAKPKPAEKITKYRDDQARDEHGRFADEGGGAQGGGKDGSGGEVKRESIYAHVYGRDIEVLVNPTEKDLYALAKEDEMHTVRVLELNDGRVLAFPGDMATHDDIAQHFGGSPSAAPYENRETFMYGAGKLFSTDAPRETRYNSAPDLSRWIKAAQVDEGCCHDHKVPFRVPRRY